MTQHACFLETQYPLLFKYCFSSTLSIFMAPSIFHIFPPIFPLMAPYTFLSFLMGVSQFRCSTRFKSSKYLLSAMGCYVLYFVMCFELPERWVAICICVQWIRWSDHLKGHTENCWYRVKNSFSTLVRYNTKSLKFGNQQTWMCILVGHLLYLWKLEQVIQLPLASVFHP